jgi:hypothetical protein
LERLSLWLRFCPDNCEAFGAMAPYWQPHAAHILMRTMAIVHGQESVEREGLEAYKSEAGLAVTLCIELLCTYILESMQRDERWRALDHVLVLVQGCGDVEVSHRVRRTLLRRLLASLVRQAQRLANEAASSAPKLRLLCAAVRVHVLQPPSNVSPVDVKVMIKCEDIASKIQPGVGLQLTPRVVPPHWMLSPAARWSQLFLSEGGSAVAEEIDLLLRLSELLDPLTVSKHGRVGVFI